jgi:acyl-CoA dehydrogenase
MSTLSIAIVTAIAVFWVLAYVGAPLLAWTVAVGAYLGGLYAAGLMTEPLTLQITGGVFFVLALLLNLPPLRRRLITGPVFAGFKKVLPEMTATEREALESGTVWWEGEMFRGKPDWHKLLKFERTRLTAEEQAFLDGPTNTLCAMLDEWKNLHEHKDLPEEVWSYIRSNGFFAMLIPKAHGGLGFSAYAQSCVVTKIATRSITAAVTVMVPNSLGPGELLVHYGTEAQQKHWLPGLAAGREIPCFGLTSPEAGSDATRLTDTGIVCMGEFEGKKVLGLRLNFSKRYITLAPVATVIGLAFRLYDPEHLLGDGDKSDYGITCALIPASHPGVKSGRRHYPGTVFMNGTVEGKDIFVPIDWIIGGKKMAGKGWRMLVECLSAGRGISLPALSTAAGYGAYGMTGIYARLRRQFKMPIGKFEGVQEAMARIAGLTYTLEAARSLTASAVDHCVKTEHKGPSVTTAIAKYHMTEMMRRVMIDAMDIHGGRGVMMGPRNYLAGGYQAVPVAITVEGANILTRSLMIFGQGAIRCHPHVFPEMEAARTNDLAAFDRHFLSHVGSVIHHKVRTLTLGVTGAWLAGSPVGGPMAYYYRQFTRMSSALYFVSNVTMGVLGGELKRKELLSARLGDVLSQLYLGSAVLKYYYDEGETQEDLDHARWALDHALAEIGKAFDEFFANFPVRVVGWGMRLVVFPLGQPYRRPSDKLGSTIAGQMMQPNALRDRLQRYAYIGRGENDVTGRMAAAFDALLAVEDAYNRFQKVANQGVAGLSFAEQIQYCVANKVISAEEARQIEAFDRLRYDAILTDDFTKEYLAGTAAVDAPKATAARVA